MTGAPMITPPRPSYLYLAPSDVLIPRVDRQCIMRFCEALGALGLDVELISLNVRLDHDEPTRTRGLFDVYGIGTPFDIKILPSRTRQSLADRTIGHPLWRLVAYSSYLAWKLLFSRNIRGDCTVIYFKNYLLTLPLLTLRRMLGGRVLLLFEAHAPTAKRMHRALLSRVDGVVAISYSLARRIRDQVHPAPVLVAHQGVNLEMIERVRLEKHAARKKLGLPKTDQLVVYTGKVNDESREIELLLLCARHLADEAELVIVGGRQDHVERLRKRARERGIENVRFVEFVAPADVFHYQMAADVLVSYYPSELALNPFRSPGKLFEYMASRRPMVMADYPSLREVLRPASALFVGRDDPEQLAHGIRRVLSDDSLAESLAAGAYEDVAAYTWDARAERVHNFVLGLLSARTTRLAASTENIPAVPSDATEERRQTSERVS
jgi:glycosyltransferase involved in cell wall biosynthesis